MNQKEEKKENQAEGGRKSDGKRRVGLREEIADQTRADGNR
jgi:hypothetical protein